MKLFIETCLNDLFVAVIDNNKVVSYRHEVDLIKKSDALSGLIVEVVKEAKADTKELEVYVTNGPGSFMGVRAGLLYASTFTQINETKLYLNSSLGLLKAQGLDKVFIDAKSNQSYSLDENNTPILIDHEEATNMDYKMFKANPEQFLKTFAETKPEEVIFNYVKEPRIG